MARGHKVQPQHDEFTARPIVTVIGSQHHQNTITSSSVSTTSSWVQVARVQVASIAHHPRRRHRRRARRLSFRCFRRLSSSPPFAVVVIVGIIKLKKGH